MQSVNLSIARPSGHCMKSEYGLGSAEQCGLGSEFLSDQPCASASVCEIGYDELNKQPKRLVHTDIILVMSSWKIQNDVKDCKVKTRETNSECKRQKKLAQDRVQWGDFVLEVMKLRLSLPDIVLSPDSLIVHPKSFARMTENIYTITSKAWTRAVQPSRSRIRSSNTS